MDSIKAASATDESRQSDGNEESRKALHAWLAENSSDALSAAQDLEACVLKLSWNAEVDYEAGQWLFETPQWASFNKEDGRAVLWLQGPPGCGKSVLTARIITTLQAQQPESSTSILYHYCHRDPQPTTSLDIVRSLLAQCLGNMKEDIVDALNTLQTKKPKLKPGDMLAEKLLWTALQKAIAGNQHRTYLVIDGLDESQPNASPLGRLLALLTGLGDESRTSLLLSSRFDCDIIEALQESESLEYLQIDVHEEAIHQDMLQYVTHRVNNKASPLRRNPKPERDDIIRKVCQQAQSSFLYAVLVLDELKGERVFSRASIAATLQSLPLQLRNIYERLLEIPKASAMGKEVFQWVSCAARPLSWDEIRSVLAIIDGNVSEDHLTYLACDVFVQESCGPLIEAFGPNRDQLRFVHPTVKDVLLEKEGPGMELDILGGHALIAMKLLYFLQNEDLPSFSPELSFEDNRELISEFAQRPGFGIYSYAALNWFFHVARCGSELQEAVEEQLCGFLSSPSCILWLKGALFMSKWKGQARDSTALTTDVVESLETWNRNRTSTVELGATTFVRTWISHFLDLMQDWGRALESNPFWIHLIPKQFIDDDSYFRQALTYRAEQAVIQLEERPFLTAKTHPTLWQEHCVSVDNQRGLAYTWEQSSVQLSCYHMRTGLLAAQTKLDLGDRDLSSFELVIGVQCPQNRFLALLFRDKSEINKNNPVYDNLRRGLQPTSLAHNAYALSWVMQNELSYSELFPLTYTLAVGNICSLTCVMELSHDGFMRTNLFGHPKWSLDSYLAVEEQLLRWELDDINLLAFSPDSSLLATPSSVISTETGKKMGTFSLGLEPSVSGCAIAQDFRTFVIVRSGSTLEYVQVPGSSGSAVTSTHKFPGLVHILGVSNGGRFTLLLRVHQHIPKTSSGPNNADKFLQDGYIGVFDSKKKHWTPFVEVHPPLSRLLSSWDFSESHILCQFNPESRKVFETNKVAFQCPRGWTLSEKVRCSKALAPAQLLEDKCMVVVESEKLKDGFGTNPTLTYVGKTSKMSPSIPKILYTDFVLGNWSPVNNSRTELLLGNHYHDEELQLSPFSPYQSGPLDYPGEHQAAALPHGDCVMISSDIASQIYRIRLQLVHLSDYQTLRHEEMSQTGLNTTQFSYHISLSHGTLEEDGQFDIHAANIVVQQSGLLPLQLQDIAIHNGALAIGTSVINLEALSSVNGTIQYVKTHDEISALIKSFKSSCQPFAATSEPAASTDNEIPHYTIFSNEQISFQNIRPTADQLQLTNVSEQRDIMLAGVSTALNCDKYVAQFTKPVEKKMLKQYQKEAAETEVFVNVFDSHTGCMTWSLHTTSAGKIKQQPGYLSKATWAFHPNQPLLFWTLPGHALHVSHIKSSSPPINVGDSLIIENENFESIRFSPAGRYVALLATSAFVQAMLIDYTKELATQVLVVLDLHLGTNTTLKVLRKPTLSFDIDEAYLKVYRLTDLGGVRMDRFTLPDLHHHDQQILTFIPDHCCCATCGKPLKDTCYVSVRECLGLRRIVLCHSPISSGSTTASGSACEPLILSIASPELPIDPTSVVDSIVISRRTTTFPSVISLSGDCIPEAFTNVEHLTLADDLAARTDGIKVEFEKRSKRNKNTPGNGEGEGEGEGGASETIRQVYQMQARMSNSAGTDGQELDVSTVKERWRLDYQKSVSDTRIPDSLAHFFSGQEAFEEWSAEYGDLFPETWAEFVELLAIVADDPEINDWIKIFCQDAGVGCITPIYTHTFYYGDARQDGKGDFTWTSAIDYGWIEEHAEWFIRRLWADDFVGARMWYPFEHYHDFSAIKIKKEEKGEKNGNKVFGTREILQLDLSEVDTDEEVGKAVRGVLAMRKFIDDVEDRVPGAGKMFRTRFHQFLNQSLLARHPAEGKEEQATQSRG